MMTVSDYVSHWEKIDSSNKRYILKEDSEFFTEKNSFSLQGYDNYLKISHSQFPNSNALHLGLYPQPYAGNLANAKVFILLLNPGFLFTSYYEEQNHPDFRQELINTINQKELTEDFPFMWLNPKFLWTAGGQYWFRKLKSHIEKYRKEKQTSFYDALSFFSKKIAVLQLYPYHSEASPNENLIKRLKSAELAKKF